jgi:adenylate kinase
MNLIFVGPPGAGKGTQAAAIVAEFRIPHVSTGDIIRDAIKRDTPMGREFKSYSDSGRLVPDELVNSLVALRLAGPDCDHGFLLDGYPRTLDQGKALDFVLERRGLALDHVLLLDVADAILIERITGRRMDPETGRVYHVRFDPPPADVAARVVQRRDDTEEVLARRLAEYHESTDLVAPYYASQGLLRPIDGTGSMEDVRRRLMEVLHAAPAEGQTGSPTARARS